MEISLNGANGPNALRRVVMVTEPDHVRVTIQLQNITVYHALVTQTRRSIASLETVVSIVVCIFITSYNFKPKLQVSYIYIYIYIYIRYLYI